jgi:phytanoyl-CoA hydroxylase
MRTYDARNNNADAQMMSGGMLSRDCAAFAAEHDRKWLIADYEAGDVVFHHARKSLTRIRSHAVMVHSSAINRDEKQRIRLATDIRFANADAPYDDRWTRK